MAEVTAETKEPTGLALEEGADTTALSARARLRPDEEGGDDVEGDSRKLLEPSAAPWWYTVLAWGAPTLVIGLGIASFSVVHSYGTDASLRYLTSISQRHSPVAISVVAAPLLAVWVVLCLPVPSVLVSVNGFLLGFWTATCLNLAVICCTIVAAWTLVRCTRTQRLHSWIQGSPKTSIFMAMLHESETKYLILFRFLFLPICVKNYTVPILLPRMNLGKSLLTAVPGELFYCSFGAYIGSTTSKMVEHYLHKEGSVEVKREVQTLGQAASAQGALEWWVFVLGIASGLALVGYATVDYRRRLALFEKDGTPAAAGDVDPCCHEDDIEEPLLRSKAA